MASRIDLDGSFKRDDSWLTPALEPYVFLELDGDVGRMSCRLPNRSAEDGHCLRRHDRSDWVPAVEARDAALRVASELHSLPIPYRRLS